MIFGLKPPLDASSFTLKVKPTFEIIDETPESLCICKPAGFFIHQPEDRSFRVPRENIVLQNLRDQVGYPVYPIHRLDAATSGLVLFAKSGDFASELTRSFLATADKHYLALCRGWLPDEGQIDTPLLSDSSDKMQECVTQYQTLARIEFTEPVGKKFPYARLSLVWAKPLTGRFHQIRRHFNRISHPIIGDGSHGDSHYNRYFREKYGLPGLNLWAYYLSYHCPFRDKKIEIHHPMPPRWKQIHDLFPQKLKSSIARVQI